MEIAQSNLQPPFSSHFHVWSSTQRMKEVYDQVQNIVRRSGNRSCLGMFHRAAVALPSLSPWLHPIPSIESEAVNNHTFLPYLGNKQSFFEVWYLGLLTLRKSFSLLVGFLRHTMFASRNSSPVAQFYQSSEQTQKGSSDERIHSYVLF